MKNILSVLFLSVVLLVLQTTAGAQIQLALGKIFILKWFFGTSYVNLILVLVSYMALTRKPYEAFLWSMFFLSLSSCFGVAWSSSLSLSYLFVTMLCLSVRQNIFMTGYVQKFFFGFLLCFMAVMIEHLAGGIFERKDKMFSGLFSVALEQSFIIAFLTPWLLDLLIALDKRTLSKLQLQHLTIVFSKQREGSIAAF